MTPKQLLPTSPKPHPKMDPAQLVLPNPSSPPPTAAPSPTLLRLGNPSPVMALNPPDRRAPTELEMESWIESVQASLPDHLVSMPRTDLHRLILSLDDLVHSPDDPRGVAGPPPPDSHPARFQRTDQWKPVYAWLESLDADEVVKAKEITEWLEENEGVKEQLFARHSRYHLMHYIQKLHMKMLRRQGKIQKIVRPSNSRISTKVINGELTARAVSVPYKLSSNSTKENEIYLSRKNDAFLRFELLTDLQNQLTSLISKHKQQHQNV